VLTTAGAIGFVTLVLSGLGWISALRDGVQGVFAGRSDTNFLVLKLVDLLVFAAAGLAVLASVVVSVVVNIASDQVLETLGIPGGTLSSWAVNIAGQLVLVIVDAVIFTLLFHRLAGVPVSFRDAAVGGVAASLGFTVLKLFGSALLQLAFRNRFLAAFGVLVALLVWMNLAARVTLLGAALAATVAADRGHLATPDPATPLGVRAADAAMQEAGMQEAGMQDDVARRQVHTAADPDARRAARTLLAAGFLVGAATGWAVDRVSRGRRRARP
jgi:membrane protein